jgi:hypothetical protein
MPHFRPRSAIAAIMSAAPTAAHAAATASRTPIITGNGWLALGIIGVLVAIVYFLIRGVLHIEDRDVRRGSRDDGWYGFFPHGSDDDHPHHGNGGS